MIEKNVNQKEMPIDNAKHTSMFLEQLVQNNLTARQFYFGYQKLKTLDSLTILFKNRKVFEM